MRPNDPPPYPPFTRVALTLASAIQKHVRDGMHKCTHEQFQHRFAICRSCTSYVDQYCRQCGCRVGSEPDFLNKLSWQSESCPLEKWGAISQSATNDSPEST